MDYDVEEHDGHLVPVVRLRVPEKLARTMVDAELPLLDRLLRFVVPRGQRGSVHADTLGELQDKLDLPFTDDERTRPPAMSHPRSGGERGRGGERGPRGNGGHRHPGKGRRRR
jgi:hypothetical protein